MSTAALAGAPRVTDVGHAPNGTVAGLALAGAANVACFAGAGRVVAPAFVAAAVTFAFWLTRRRPLASAEFAMWLWLVGPQVRRVVDLTTGYHDQSLVLAAAPLASLALFPTVRTLRWQGLRRELRPLMVVAVAVVVGYGVGALRMGLRPASGMLLLWLVPILFGLQLAAVGRDAVELRRTIDRVFVWAALLLGGYGVVQFYVAPPWDVHWMTHTSMTSIGTPEPFAIRVFSTLNSPGPLAAFLAAAVLYLTGTDHPLRVPAQVAGYACLALTMVRTAWLSCLIGLMVVLAVGRARARASAVAALAIVVVAVLQLSGPFLDVVTSRIDETREGRRDDSFAARLTLHERLVPVLANEVAGRGLGSSGAGARLVQGDRGAIEDIDSGVLDFMWSLGVPLGLTALGALTLGGLNLARSGLRSGHLPVGVSAAGMSVLLQMVGGNSLTGIGGITFFALWAVALHQVTPAAIARTYAVGRST